MRKVLLLIACLTSLSLWANDDAQEDIQEINSKEETTKAAKDIEKETDEQRPTTSSSDTKWRFGIGGSIDLGAVAKSDLSIRTVSSGSTANGDAEFDLENSLNLELEARYLPANNWGFIGGLLIGLEREVKSGKVQSMDLQL